MLQAVLKIMCTPESVKTGSLNSPTFKLNETSSNAFYIYPRPKVPRSPPSLAEPHLFFK